MSSIALIGGSPSPTSRGSIVLDQVADKITVSGFDVERIEVRDIDPAALLFADFGHPDVRTAAAKIERAAGIVIATPVYKASYSGVLKSLLDLLARDAFKNKPILPIATGGTIAHLLSIDYALRPVLYALCADKVLAGRFIIDKDISTIAPNIGIENAEAWNALEAQVVTLCDEVTHLQQRELATV